MMLKQHPLSAAFPSMSDEDFATLKADIAAHGQREPIIVHEGMVLDGWHRYRACADLGIKPQQFTFDASADPVAFVLSNNLHRRHLTPSQRAAAIVACADYGSHGGNRKVQGATLPLDPAKPKVDDLAKAAQVAPRLIKDAAVAKKAGLLDEVKDGTISASAAADMARGKEPKKPKRTLNLPEEQPAADDQLIEAQHTISELAQENDELRDKLAVESLMDSEEAKTQTLETIQELRDRVRVLEAENAALKVSRDTYQREASEAKKSAIYWRKQAEKAAKEAA